VALDETSRQTSDWGFHPWTCCKHHYSFNLIFPCKFFYDRNSLTNVLRVILSGHIQRNLITVLFDSSQSLVAITTLNTQTTIERDSASGPLLSLKSQTIIGRGCSGGALPLYTHTTIERDSASGPILSLNSQTIIGRGCSRGALPLYTHTTIERGSASGPLFFRTRFLKLSYIFFTISSEFCASHHWADMYAHPHLSVRQ
jgi:hypothetical protein